MQSTLTIAQTIKRRLLEPEVPVVDAELVPKEMWFASILGVRKVPYRSIADYADKEFEAFCTPDPRVRCSSNLLPQLRAWVAGMSDHELAFKLQETPQGLTADPDTGLAIYFTPFWRLSLLFWIDHPVDVEASVLVDTETLREIGRSHPREVVQRKMPIAVTCALHKGSTPDVGICNLPTGCGKTSWGCAFGYLLLTSPRFRVLQQERISKAAGQIVSGSVKSPVARLVLFAVGATTFHHFKRTLERLLPMVQDGSTRFQIWTTMSKFYSVGVAAEAPADVATLWLIPVAKLNEVRRTHPDVAIAGCVTDEFTVDTPRERYASSKSDVLKQLILQATPQALAEATRGNRSWLRDFFGGPLEPPRAIKEHIRGHSWNLATLASRQACLLELATITPFRDFVRTDMEALVPHAMYVHTVQSRRLTLASHLAANDTDMVPASLFNTLMHALRKASFTEESRLTFRCTVDSLVPVTPDALVHLLRTTLQPRYPDLVDTYAPVVDRVVARIEEFSECCPICLDDDSRAPALRFFGCCGYAVCEPCFATCAHRGRCAFCRSEVRSTVPLASVPPIEGGDHGIRSPEGGSDYPAKPQFSDPSVHTLQQNLYTYATPNNSQTCNLTLTLHCLVHHGYNRIIVIVEKPLYSMETVVGVVPVSTVTGIDIVQVDRILGGKGTEFHKAKTRYDSPDPRPMAFLTVGGDPAFLTGTDMPNTKAVVAVGHIPESILTQAIGRIFRALPGRDPSVGVPFVKIGVRRR